MQPEKGKAGKENNKFHRGCRRLGKKKGVEQKKKKWRKRNSKRDNNKKKEVLCK